MFQTSYNETKAKTLANLVNHKVVLKLFFTKLTNSTNLVQKVVASVAKLANSTKLLQNVLCELIKHLLF